MTERIVEDLLLIYKLMYNNVNLFSERTRKELILLLAENLKVAAFIEDKPAGKYAYLHNMILTYGKYNSTASNKIGAIRQFKQETGCGLRYAKEYVEWVLGYPGSFEPE